MPCRAGSIARQAPQCLWITDDILADAFNRFARVSNAHKLKTGGRRYGSHVPGPLEAHRRSTKRRMGVAAVASSVPPPGVDFGALFGLGGFTSDRKIDGWKWEPPGLEEKPKRTGWLSSGGSKRKMEAWESFLENPESTTLEDDVDKSKQAFERLLQQRDAATPLQRGELSDLIAFLRSSANEPHARNTLRLAEWLASKHVTTDAYNEFYELLQEKAQLQTLADGELPSILCTVLRLDNRARHTAPIARFLDQLRDEDLASLCASVTESLLPDSPSEQGMPPEFEMWLRVLRTVPSLQGDHFFNSVWQSVYDILASRFSDFTALRDHFSTMWRLDVCRILLRHWVPRIPCDAQESSADFTATANLTKRIYTRPQEQAIQVDRLLQDFENVAARYRRRQERANGFTSFAQLVAVLYHHRVPYTQMCHGIFDLLMHSASGWAVFRTFRGIAYHARIGIDDTLAQRLVHYFLDKKHLPHAEKVFLAVPTLPLSACYELPIALVKYRRLNSMALWRVLQRQTQEDIVSRPGNPRNNLSLEHIDLIHLIAHYCANCENLSPRTSLRRVWECYLFLRDRLVRIRPLMTRAFLTAGVIRPLKNLQRVSVTKFRYILMLVARVEGRQVAEDLDRLVWKTWNENVLPKIRARDAQRSIDQVMGSSAAEVDASTARLEEEWKRRTNRLWLGKRRAPRMTAEDPFSVPGAGEVASAVPSQAFAEGIDNAFSPLSLAENTASYNDALAGVGQEQQPALDSSSHSPFDQASALDTATGPTKSAEWSHERDHSSGLSVHDESNGYTPFGPTRTGLGYDDEESPTLGNKVELAAPHNSASTPQESASPSLDTTGYMPMASLVTDFEEQSTSEFTPSIKDSSQHTENESQAIEQDNSDMPSIVNICKHNVTEKSSVEKPVESLRSPSDVTMVRPTFLSPRMPLRDTVREPETVATAPVDSLKQMQLRVGYSFKNHYFGALDAEQFRELENTDPEMAFLEIRDAQVFDMDLVWKQWKPVSNTKTKRLDLGSSRNAEVERDDRPLNAGSIGGFHTSPQPPGGDPSFKRVLEMERPVQGVVRPLYPRSDLTVKRINLSPVEDISVDCQALGNQIDHFGPAERPSRHVEDISVDCHSLGNQIDRVGPPERPSEQEFVQPSEPSRTTASMKPKSISAESIAPGRRFHKEIEIECWKNTTMPSPSAPPPLTHDFLQWRVDIDGRYRLYVEWQGEWLKIKKAQAWIRESKKLGQPREARDVLRERIRAAWEGRASFLIDAADVKSTQVVGPDAKVMRFRPSYSDGKGLKVVPDVKAVGRRARTKRPKVIKADEIEQRKAGFKPLMAETDEEEKPNEIQKAVNADAQESDGDETSLFGKLWLDHSKKWGYDSLGDGKAPNEEN